MSKKTKIMLGWPWYGGPDRAAFARFFEFTHYCGRLQERSYWLAEYGELPDMPNLNREKEDSAFEIAPEDGVFEFAYYTVVGNSLIGRAREEIVEAAQQWGADYLFMYDDDMIWGWDTLLRLLRHNKPVVNALGFTSREPITPCMWKIQRRRREDGEWEYSDKVIYDYPKDQLVGQEDLGGPVAFGAGVTLYNMNVFNQMPKPWFSSTGCGEDWFFCIRCYQDGIPLYVDTSIKTHHKSMKVDWQNEELYLQRRSGDLKDYIDGRVAVQEEEDTYDL